MLINAGKLLMVFVWGFMMFNLIHPFPKPLKYFIDVAMIFMIFMHAIFLHAAFAKTEKHPCWLQIKIFLFGVFELLASQKRQKLTNYKKNRK
ncbi:hypothetical protein ARAF_1527 [Arsenophonus endosymbiont of Aleurodicus floccissimus]|uniref:DUF1145 domain-containing protein n=1 Tax=Arsenophonus endosymbiont of Aleurodicus floccissimus TaxID=2152761 RepID=UPI000E6B4541|nr:DUF1145 domain-containing protein [Arsenophonus endosymbiont of Aleurodicus floccissimus]SPP31861.1 hypothetical protein ARAF_1527 [Arsenophonus endosymbiont of Aleurodicus floccissimus]